MKAHPQADSVETLREAQGYYVYLLTNADHSRIYTGITNDLKRRVSQHRLGRGGRFTRTFGVTRLVYYETCPDKSQALKRELQIKRSGRQKKMELIQQGNSEWKDLFEGL
jgi:putative endonuclease